ncbi:ABC transporter permease [Wenzhouxiangella sp. AB-CW3]|uniref:ABC transporter permease n=1 Tax=Wenzhouxiangella sp. AB-CW3 TaxID=2771012 RepID=UPI00168AA7E4|nr:ABC transporter permease [Wenzhouxiangella sp. AB-CW3]QOC24158.1 ABC transporter permease [Wenzhouxiangella sp. AB-CW3]
MRGLEQTFSLAWRAIVQLRRNPWELGDYSFQPVLFLLLFVYIFGGAISGSIDEALTWMLPGIIVMNMMFVTVYVGHGLNTDLTGGYFDRLRALPVARWAPLAGRITADLVKQGWSIALLLGLGWLMGFRMENPAWGLAVMVVLVLIFALAFSWVSVLVGVIARDPEHVHLFGFTALFPITFVSNVFVPVETLPPWLQGIVMANPVSILTDACRGLLLGGPWVQSALIILAWAIGLTLVFMPLSLRALRRRLQ